MSFIRFVCTSTLASLLACAAFAQTPGAATQPVASPAIPTPAVKGPDAPVTRAELPALVREAILNDPEMVMEAAQKIREKGEEELAKKRSEAFLQNKAEIVNDTISPSIGDPKTADITVVEFFDYQCGYCKHMQPAIDRLVQDDKKVRIIFREYPILSEQSVKASRAALAVHKLNKDKYFAFHSDLMNSKERLDDNLIFTLAKKQGITKEKLEAELSKPEYGELLERNRKLGQALGITGTPALIIEDQIFPGAISYNDLAGLIKEARESKNAPAAAPASPATAPARPN